MYHHYYQQQQGGATNDQQQQQSIPSWVWTLISVVVILLLLGLVYFLLNRKINQNSELIGAVYQELTTNVTKLGKDSKPIQEAFKKMKEFLGAPATAVAKAK